MFVKRRLSLSLSLAKSESLVGLRRPDGEQEALERRPVWGLEDARALSGNYTKVALDDGADMV